MFNVPLRYTLVHLLQIHRRDTSLSVLWLGSYLGLTHWIDHALVPALAHIARLITSVALTWSRKLLLASWFTECSLWFRRIRCLVLTWGECEVGITWREYHWYFLEWVLDSSHRMSIVGERLYFNIWSENGVVRLCSELRPCDCLIIIAHESNTMVGLLWWVLVHTEVVGLIVWICWILEEVWVAYEWVQRITVWSIYDAILFAELWGVEPLQSRHGIINTSKVSTFSIFANILYQEVLIWFLISIFLLLTHLLNKAEFTSFIHSDRVFARAVHHLNLTWSSLGFCRLLIWVHTLWNSGTFLNI